MPIIIMTFDDRTLIKNDGIQIKKIIMRKWNKKMILRFFFAE